MFLLTGEALVISLLIIASRAWPTSRSKNNSSYGWISSGDVSHLQASGVIPRNTSTDIPSPRSFDGGATDQTILANTRQFNTNYMTSRQQERQSNMGSQMNPYQSNINKSPHATERNKQGYDHEIHSTTNEHRINLHQLSREVMISLQHQQHSEVYNETQDPDASGSKIVFPGEMSGNTVIKFKPQVNGPRPPCADGSSFCETTDEYPHDYVRNLLKNEASIGIGFTDFLPIPVGTRIQPDEQHYLCASSEHVVYPKMAQNKDQKWLFVLNEDSYLQGVRIEKCEKQGPCSFSDNFPLGFVTTCQQKYIYRKLLALGEDGKPTSDSFRLPSCCSCLVTRPVPSPRMSGVGKDQTPATSRKRRR